MAKSKTKSTEECSTTFEIDVPAQSISKAFDEVYAGITKIANIPGFRVGKAPIELVKKHYAKDAREEVLKRLIPEAYRNAISEHKISPISLPEITDVVFEGEDKLSFKARVETRPKFKLKDYKGLELKKKNTDLTDADVEKALQNLVGLNAKYIAVEDRALAMGDYAVSDLECYVDGKSAHKKRENLWLYIDKESLVPELSQKMVGMKKGEERDIDVTFPEKHPDAKLVGKAARYHVLVKEIKSRVLPAMDDEFAKDLGKANMEEVKSEISKELQARAKVQADIDLENQLLSKLIDDNVFDVPSSFVTRQLDHMIEDAKRRLVEKGFRHEDLDKKDAEFKEKFKADAARQVRLLFILDEIAKNENVDVAEKDLADAYRAIAAQAGKSEGAVKEYYEKEDYVDSLKDKIREEKTIQFLIQNSKVT